MLRRVMPLELRQMARPGLAKAWQTVMPPERQVQHQTATQPVREAWLQTVRQELAKPQRRVSLPEQQHQTETREPVTRLQTVSCRAQVSRPRKEKQRRRVKRGPALASEPQRKI